MRRDDCRCATSLPRTVAAAILCLLFHVSFAVSESDGLRSGTVLRSSQGAGGSEDPVPASAASALTDELDVEAEISRKLISESSSEEKDSLRLDEMVKAIVGFKKRKQNFLVSQSPAHSQVTWPMRLPVLHTFKRINAELVRISRKDMQLLANDPNVAYVEEDRRVFAFSETVPWGIPAIQANGTNVPPPDNQDFEPDEACFNICIVDSGFHLGHTDLV
jgi:hypothetical protein